MNTKQITIRTLLLALCVLVSSAACAHGGMHGGGGGWNHGGFHNNGFHNNGWHNGWHNNGWRGAGWNNGWNNGWRGAAVIGVPVGGYYAPYCNSVRVCNSYGKCWLKQQCN